ncbi:MAG: calcium/sodium antiporter [Rhodospirillales bacterium]|jgi:cation:H+ antiporter|nr:calcium/sodium antiporter [Rhodospirillales bacterium]
MVYAEIAVGLVLLVIGAELLVRGSVTLARRLGVSSLLIGLTLVGFGTSTPELVASVTGALKGSPGIAVGNVIGSNICNVLLILGSSALLCPLATTRKAFIRDGPVLLGASLLLLAITWYGWLSRPVGAIFVVLLAGYILYTYRTEKVHPNSSGALHSAEAEQVPSLSLSWPAATALALAGIGVLVSGAYLLVDGAIQVARGYGISETIIGLTVVAIGTSLPELATSVVAAVRKEADVAIGNVVGSNIYNILGILGVTALVQPIAMPPEIMAFDIWVMLAAAVLLVVFALSGLRINRWEGGLLLAGYAAYIAYLASIAGAAPAAAG